MRPKVPQTLLYRSVGLPVTIAIAALLMALILLARNAWHGVERLKPVHDHLQNVTLLQISAQRLQKVLLDELTETKGITPADVAQIQNSIGLILTAKNSRIDPGAVAALREAQVLLRKDLSKISVIHTLNRINYALRIENRAHVVLLDKAKRDTEFEFSLASATSVALPGFALTVLFLIRKRVLTPLNTLGLLMVQLARREPAPFPETAISETDRILRPLLKHYNQMVSRLIRLEEEHLSRQETLESQVRSSTSSLLEQQRALAKAEKLATVGKLAAQLAHELRNPLAGMQLAIVNLQLETDDSGHRERLSLVAMELQRMTTLLNDLLHQSRHQPEPLRVIQVSSVVDELISLARYQLPDHIRLQSEVPDTLKWNLPENELRCCLLNLILNACDAINEQSGLITISMLVEDSGDLIIEVSDDGQGFPEAILKSGVRSFHTTRSDGTGLGLSYVQRFVKDLHGDIYLGNRKIRGACVRLHIPYAGEIDG